MAGITDQRAIDISNRGRQGCDRLQGMFEGSQDLIEAYQTQGLSGLFPGGGNQIMDGSPQDGREPVTDDDFANLLLVFQILGNQASQPVSNAPGAPTILQVVRKFAVNPQQFVF